MLSEKVLYKLKAYYKTYKPKVYVFEGQYRGQYSIASLRQVPSGRLQKAGVNQKPTLHWLGIHLPPLIRSCNRYSLYPA